METERISPIQLFSLIMLFFISSSTLIVPKLLAMQVKQDAWISAALCTLLTIPLITLYTALAEPGRDASLIEQCRSILGYWAGTAVSLIFIVYFLIITTGLARQLADQVTTIFLPETPIEAVLVLIFFILVYAVRSGLEVFARASTVFMPWMMGAIVFLGIFLLPDVESKNILPLGARGIPPILRGTLTNLGFPIMDMIIFLMIYPYVRGASARKKTMYIATILGGSILTLVTLLATLVLGPKTVAQSIYPVYDMAQRINIGNFIQRIESIVAGVWFVTLFFKILICFYGLTLAFAQVCSLSNYRILAVPMAGMVMALSLQLTPNTVHFLEFLNKIWAIATLLPGLLIPLLLVAVLKAKVRFRKSGNTNE